MIQQHQIDAARQTAALYASLGDTGKRLTSKRLVAFANQHGCGETFVFGDRVFIIDAGSGAVVVVKAT